MPSWLCLVFCVSTRRPIPTERLVACCSPVLAMDHRTVCLAVIACLLFCLIVVSELVFDASLALCSSSLRMVVLCGASSHCGVRIGGRLVSCSKVMLARDKETGQKVALKKIRLDYGDLGEGVRCLPPLLNLREQ